MVDAQQVVDGQQALDTDHNKGLSESLGELERVARQIVFLNRELQQYSYAGMHNIQFNVHQIVDDTLALLHPMLEERGILLFPVFDEKCAFDFEGKPEIISALMFNFILTRILMRETHAISDDISYDIERAKTLMLQVNFNETTGLVFDLSPLNQTDSRPSLPRLEQLIGSTALNIEATKMSIPVTATMIPGQRARQGTTARIVVQNHIQQHSIESRLFNLGVEISENESTPSICVIGFEQHEDITNITNKLNPQTKVLLLNNSTLYKQENWYQLRNPIDHVQLTQTIQAHTRRIEENYRLLIVDDYDANLQLLTMILEEMGHTVVAVNNPMDAITRAKLEQFDLIFMDIQLPGISGTQTSRMIREQGFTGRIIALTAHLSEQETTEILQFGINDALLKPVDKKALKNVLNRWLKSTDDPAETSISIHDSLHENNQPREIFSERLALRRANHRPDLANELLQLLMDSLPDDLESLNSAYTTQDAEMFRRQVHKIHGASRYCGVPRLGRAIESLESLAKQDRMLQSDAIRQALNVTNGEIKALREWYVNVAKPFNSQS